MHEAPLLLQGDVCHKNNHNAARNICNVSYSDPDKTCAKYSALYFLKGKKVSNDFLAKALLVYFLGIFCLNVL